MRWILVTLLSVIFAFFSPVVHNGQSAEFVIYSVYHSLDLGNQGEVGKKDFYINMGYAQGVHEGSILQVSRRVSSFDEVNHQLYRDLLLPIAHLKVIHVEQNASIARVDKMLTSTDSPIISPNAVMVGDLVQPPGFNQP